VAPTAQASLFGAYAPLPADSPLAREARDFVQSRMVGLVLGEVNVAYVQVVSGMNVKLICSATDEGKVSSWKFQAFRSLDGQWHFGLAQHL